MKALSLWQPWATLMACDSKRIETRSWKTNYRGVMAIHAAKRKKQCELLHFGCMWGAVGALRPIGARFGKEFNILEALPFGAFVAIATLVDCRPTDSFTNAELDTERKPDDDRHGHYRWTERMFGDYALGRFGWVFENIKPLDPVIPYKAMQGIFNAPDEIFSAYLVK